MAQAPGPEPLGALADLSLEQLSDVEVTSVSKRTKSVGEAPAAVFVISTDDMQKAACPPAKGRLTSLVAVADLGRDGRIWSGRPAPDHVCEGVMLCGAIRPPNLSLPRGFGLWTR
jgi:hypothetical protein